MTGLLWCCGFHVVCPLPCIPQQGPSPIEHPTHAPPPTHTPAHLSAGCHCLLQCIQRCWDVHHTPQLQAGAVRQPQQHRAPHVCCDGHQVGLWWAGEGC